LLKHLSIAVDPTKSKRIIEYPGLAVTRLIVIGLPAQGIYRTSPVFRPSQSRSLQIEAMLGTDNGIACGKKTQA
jgi:hypothetical protein